MAFRTNHQSVKDVLGEDYDSEVAVQLDKYIRAANLIVTRVAACATAKGNSMSTDELKEMECWLGAHFYTKSDPTYLSKNTSQAGGQFARNPECPEPYKDGALALDFSGCLNAILNRQRAYGFWGGTTDAEARTYDERNNPTDS